MFVSSTVKNAFKNSAHGWSDIYSPGSFSFVMATGIISISAHLVNMEIISGLLFQVNKVAYALLIVVTLFRALRRPLNFIDMMRSYEHGPPLFTLVVGTTVLGSQFAILSGDLSIGFYLWVAGVFLWFVFSYAFFVGVIVGESKPVLDKDFDGGWLIYVVGTEALSVLATLIAAGTQCGECFLFFALILHMLGGMLYIVFIVLLFHRLVFHRLPPEGFTPSYWINMGADAITVLAGSTLILTADKWVLLRDVLPFLKGFSLLFWAMSTWWIPLLTIMNIWRHIQKGSPPGYDVRYWSMVFPLGMYTACTFQMARALELEALYHVPNLFIYIAFIAWLFTFTTFVRRVLQLLFFFQGKRS